MRLGGLRPNGFAGPSEKREPGVGDVRSTKTYSGQRTVALGEVEKPGEDPERIAGDWDVIGEV